MMFYEWIFPKKFSNEDFMGESKFFSNFCQVYHTRSFLGDIYEHAYQL